MRKAGYAHPLHLCLTFVPAKWMAKPPFLLTLELSTVLR